MLFKAPSGEGSQAQIEAFEDTWHWNEHAELAFDETIKSGNTDAAELLIAMRKALGDNDMMAYLAMMAVRLIELHRVLKASGSLYLHCDPLASHYLKILLDSIFGPTHFQSEIIWRRTGAHNKATRWAPIHDVIFFYTKGADYVWNNPKRPYMRGHVKEHFVLGKDGKYRTAYYGNVLTGSGIRHGESGQPWKGIDPTAKGRHWAIPGKLWDDCGLSDAGLSQHEKLDLLYKHGLIKIESGAAWPMYERVIQKGEGPATPDIWAFQPYTEGTVHDSDLGIDADVRWLSPRDAERLGYPTQKPVSLLERIISASSNNGDLVLDPFCGCGTTVHAAQKLNRRWAGIDITHLAIGLVERRLKDVFPGIQFEVHGTPKDFSGAEDLAKRDKYQFQWWAVTLINAVPYGGKKKGADSGIDGYYYCKPDGKKTEAGIVSVKGGETLHRDMVSDLRGVMEREKAPFAVFIALRNPTGPMIKEAAAAGFIETPFGKFPRMQIATVADLLDGKLPKLPPQERGGGYKQAAREEKEQDRLL